MKQVSCSINIAAIQPLKKEVTMTTILQSDFFKLRRNIGLKLLPLAAFIWSVVTSCFMLFVQAGATVEGEAFTAGDVFGFMPIGSTGAYALSSISSLYGMAVVVFSGLFISTEFTQGTIRNTLCIGVSRTKVYLAKLAVSAVALALCMFLSCITFITGFTVAYGFGGMTYEKTQSACGLCAFFLRHIFAVAGNLRFPLSQPQKRRIAFTLGEI